MKSPLLPFPFSLKVQEEGDKRHNGKTDPMTPHIPNAHEEVGMGKYLVQLHEALAQPVYLLAVDFNFDKHWSVYFLLEVSLTHSEQGRRMESKKKFLQFDPWTMLSSTALVELPIFAYSLDLIWLYSLSSVLLSNKGHWDPKDRGFG